MPGDGSGGGGGCGGGVGGGGVVEWGGLGYERQPYCP